MRRYAVMHPNIVGWFTSTSIIASLGIADVSPWVAVITGASALFGLGALRTMAFTWRGERNAEKAKAERIEGELADEREAHRVTAHKLEVSEKKPDIAKLYELMRDHDARMAALAVETTKVLAEVSSNLRENTHAVQLWATQQAADFNNTGGTR